MRKPYVSRFFLVVIVTLIFASAGGPGQAVAAPPLRVATFEVDASPAIGSPLAYDSTKEVTSPLSCRGLVLMGSGEPIVICTVDWLGVANTSQTEFRSRLARAAGTSVDRVAVHSLHQHDAPRCDFSADELLDEYAPQVRAYDSAFAREVMDRAAEALRDSVKRARAVTQVGLGSADVAQVASNRRILGPDGKVAFTRWTACADPKLRAMPVGTIDPSLKMVSLWQGDEPLVVLTYYATHPQSYYRTGGANPDFPGMARNDREAATGIPHIHFTGAAGNVGAGKWNDGARENRRVLADRLVDAMKRAWDGTTRKAIDASMVEWRSVDVRLPVASHLNETELIGVLQDPGADEPAKLAAAKGLAWLRRSQRAEQTEITCLRLGDGRILQMPGELFVEYQLAAQEMAPDRFVAMAAYGDYGPGYIGTRVAYSQGGYETSPGSSLVAPGVERVLMDALAALLKN
jgi:hypothetical protein